MQLEVEIPRLQAWGTVKLAADPTLTQMSIARSFNRGQAWTYTRLRRYPPADAENGPAGLGG